MLLDQLAQFNIPPKERRQIIDKMLELVDRIDPVEIEKVKVE